MWSCRSRTWRYPRAATVDVPLVIHVPPDSPTDLPVRVTVRARDAQGDQVTAFAHLTPRADVAPVDPVRTWPVPAALLGGLDVASLAVGRRAGVTHRPSG